MPHVLVVDDDPSIRQVVAEVLADDGYGVQTATNGAEALQVIRQSPPALILLDLMMPVMDGWTFARTCHQVPQCADVPILVLSASHNLPASAEALRPLGVRACLAKPFDVDVLLGAVERLLP